MTTAAEDQTVDTPPEPPAKRRRAGRRSMNPEISAEERKRLRVLKNRESAMRSLAKKAEYSAKLEALEKEAIADYRSKRENLEILLRTAVELRTMLDKVTEDVPKLMAEAEACINKATAVIAVDGGTQSNYSRQGTPDNTAVPTIHEEDEE